VVILYLRNEVKIMAKKTEKKTEKTVEKLAENKGQSKSKRDPREVCKEVFEASRHWTTRDEQKIPVLRSIRLSVAECLGEGLRKPKKVMAK
jgi:predicted kinase